MEEWIAFILGEGNKLPAMEEESDRIIQYGAALIEIVWITRNMVVKGKDIPTWEELTKTITNTFAKYYIGMENKAARRRGRYGLNKVWTKPIPRTLKMNFDAAYKDGKQPLE